MEKINDTMENPCRRVCYNSHIIIYITVMTTMTMVVMVEVLISCLVRSVEMDIEEQGNFVRTEKKIGFGCHGLTG